MGVPYKIVTKNVPDGKGGREIRFHLQAAKKRTIGIKKLSKYISRVSSVHKANVRAVLEGLTEAIPYFLAEGCNVDLGDFGSFYAHLSSEGVKDIKQAGPHQLRKITVQFKPSKEFAKEMRSDGIWATGKSSDLAKQREKDE